MAAPDVSEVELADGGRLRGTREGSARRFRGVPYASAERFGPPRPVTLDGRVDATSAGPACPQPPNPLPVGHELRGPEPADPPGDESACLTIDIAAPVGASDAPVIVWVHGGTFVSGWNAAPSTDPAALVERGCVVVRVGYRLGPFGFLAAPDGVTNAGLRDIAAAVEWVSRHVDAFGGDRDNITAVGHSAGAMAIGALLATPTAARLRRAWLSSGAGHAGLEHRTACAVAGRHVVVADGPLRDLTAAELLDVAIQVGTELAAPAGLGVDAPRVLPFQPVVDGDALPARGIDAPVADVDLVLTTQRDEWRSLSHVDPPPAPLFAAMLGQALAPLGVAVPDLLPPLPDDETGQLDALAAVAGELLFQVPARRLADRYAGAGREVWRGEFAWSSPALGGALGAFHGLDVPLLFGTADRRPGLFGASPPAVLERTTLDALSAFATHGAPDGWARSDGSRAGNLLDDGGHRVVQVRDDAVRRRLLDTGW